MKKRLKQEFLVFEISSLNFLIIFLLVKRKLPKVNIKTAARILKDEKSKNKTLLDDERFQDMFKNPDFEVDETNEKYKYYHPSEKVFLILWIHIYSFF